MPRKPETFLTFYADPGEDFGWALGRDLKLLAAGTGKMWDVARDLGHAVENPQDSDNELRSVATARRGVTQKDLLGPIGRIVSEDWRLYPWILNPPGGGPSPLAWDQCRTARVIGAMKYIAMAAGIPMVLQPAAIKPAAVAAGAEELYYRPLRENRHQNDAIQHFCFYTNTELLGLNLTVPESSPEAA